MVDDRISLTFSVRNNPGRYALLLGSGVSTGAGIPTGWTVVTRLAERVAAADGASLDDDVDPTDWYEETYDEPATYENIIKGLAETQTERRSLLEEFFEPTEEEIERDEKTPTKAHESIAWLVDNGYLNVILTTNFDQLIEQALRNHGVNPVVISGEESAMGAEPLQHQDAVVVKVNGDYKQTNVRNLSSELESYSEPMQRIIDRVLQEYGLIICGWSADYDIRLRETLQECETHRYSTYWTHYSELGDEASELVAHRGAFTIKHDGAAPFFTDLRERVQALTDAEEGEPLTTAIARERVKRYLPREEHQIDLADLIRDVAQETSENIHNEDRFPLNKDIQDEEFSFENRYREYGNLTQKMLTVAMTCGYWGEDTNNSGKKAISDAMAILAPSRAPDNKFKDYFLDLQRYPATLVLYGAGLTGMKADNWTFISTLLSTTLEVYDSRHYSITESSVVEALHPQRLTVGWGRGFDREGADSTLRTSMKEALKEPGMEFFVSESQYEQAFEDFEILFDLIYFEELIEDHTVHLGTTYWEESLDRVEQRVEEQQEEWGPIQSGIIDLTADESVELLDILGEHYY